MSFSAAHASAASVAVAGMGGLVSGVVVLVSVLVVIDDEVRPRRH
jgi:hypothetical protein